MCLAINKDRSLYAVGSQSHVTLFDPRAMNISTVIQSEHRGCGKLESLDPCTTVLFCTVLWYRRKPLEIYVFTAKKTVENNRDLLQVGVFLEHRIL